MTARRTKTTARIVWNSRRNTTSANTDSTKRASTMTTDNTNPDSTLTAPTTAALTALAEQLQAAMMGLATAGLCQDGKDAALVAFDRIEAGQAELQLEARRDAAGLELVIYFSSHGTRQPVTHLRLPDAPAARAAH